MVEETDTSKNTQSKHKGEPTDFAKDTLNEVLSMARYALETGIDFPVSVAKQIEEIDLSIPDDVEKLIILHKSLSKVIAPAIPRGIAYANRSERHRRNPFKETPVIVFDMLILTCFFLVAFIVISSQGCISEEVLEAGFLYRNSIDQLLVSLLLISAAGIGACFFNLYAMYDYIVKNRYDPKFSASYWLRLALGIVSGYLLAEIIPSEYTLDAAIGKPLLALLGGFSADVVNWTLQRLVETLKTLIKGGTDSMIKSREDALKAKLEADRKMQALELKTKILSFKDTLISTSKLSEEELKEIDEIVKGL